MLCGVYLAFLSIIFSTLVLTVVDIVVSNANFAKPKLWHVLGRRGARK